MNEINQDKPQTKCRLILTLQKVILLNILIRQVKPQNIPLGHRILLTLCFNCGILYIKQILTTCLNVHSRQSDMEKKAGNGAHCYNVTYTITTIRILPINSTSKLLCCEVSNPICTNIK